MRKRQFIKRDILDRFTASTHADPPENLDRLKDDGEGTMRFRRFLKTIRTRKQQILERMLLEEG